MSIIVRRWNPADIPDVQRIAWTTWLATYGGFIPEVDMRSFFAEHYAAEVLETFCSADYARGFLAEADAVPVGFAKTAFTPDDGRFYLNSLYVLPDFHGRGIGFRLLQASERFAATLRATDVWLGVMTHNVTALDWYRRLGFQFVREEPFTMGHTTVQHLIGYRSITPGPPTTSTHL